MIWTAPCTFTRGGEIFTDPHWIDPGWELTVPDVPTASPAAQPTPSQPSAGAPSPPAASTPAVALPPPALGVSTPAAHRGGTSPATHPSAHQQETAQDWPVTLAEGGTLAALSALAIAGLLVAAQRHERWRRRPGDPTGSRAARLAQRPSIRRIRAAVAGAAARAATRRPPHRLTNPSQTRMTPGTRGHEHGFFEDRTPGPRRHRRG